MPNGEQESRARQVEPVSCFDRDLINYLRSQKNMTLKEIAELAGLTESYMSRVASGESPLTRKPLGRLLKNLGEPLAYLLLRATPKESIRQEDRELHEHILRILDKSADFGEGMRRRKR
jgi:transcriptional regulator with XRE-family HTH domain